MSVLWAGILWSCYSCWPLAHPQWPWGLFCDLLRALALLAEKTLTSEELSQLQELLCNGYWAFECLTVRDYNDMICGICGVAPKVEMAQRNEENVLALKSVEVSASWPPLELSSHFGSHVPASCSRSRWLQSCLGEMSGFFI